MKRTRKFTVAIERDEEGYYIATVRDLKGCHTQAKNLDTLVKRTREAIDLCLEVDRDEVGPLFPPLCGGDIVTVCRIGTSTLPPSRP